MSRRIFILVLPALLSMVAACGPTEKPGDVREENSKATARERGEQIVNEYLKRDAAPFRKTRARLTITPPPPEPAKIYVLEIYRKQTAAETRTLMRVVEPKDEQDVASLTVEQKGKPTVNIAYVASTGQFRESGTNKIFFGGLTAQELLGEWQKYESRLLAEKTRQEDGGARVFEVESTLKPEADSIVKRHVTLFNAEDYLPLEIHLFGSENKELRVFKMTETRDVENRKVIWRTEIENHIYKTRISIEILSMTFAENFPDEIFDREYLKEISRK